MKTLTSLLAAAVLLCALPAATQAAIGIPGLGKKSGGGAGANGNSFLQQLTPGSVKFVKAYAKYYEALGHVEDAKKMEAQAEAIQKGGTVGKDEKKVMDNAQKDIKEKTLKAGTFNEKSEALWKEGNGLYAAGLTEWAAVSAAVSLALKDDPSAALTNPALSTAALLCIKGMKDMTGFLDIMQARSAEKKEQEKGAK